MVQRYFLEVAYDGTAFHGSQIQGGTATVQLAVNKAVSMLLREEVQTFGASRTDEGVHALGNFYHFDTEKELHPHFHYKINAILPPTLSVNNVYRAVDPQFNARFDALTRSYRYRIYSVKDPFCEKRAYFFPYAINENLLQESAAQLKTYTDFESFAKRNSQTFTFQCTIHESTWVREGNQLHFIVKANRFLRGMVRALVGTQLQLARGRYDLQQFRRIIEAKDCTLADFSVPGHGLYLEKIEYPEGALEKLHLM